MSDLVLSHQNDDLFEITLNRPQKRNAINLEMLEALDSAISAAERCQGVRALLIRGAGPAFSAGIDVTVFMLLAQRYGDHWQNQMRRITDDFQHVFTRLERLEIPTIAVLHGYCLGLAFELALACDMRLAASGTQIGLPETRLGIIPDVGGTTRLTRLVGPGRAKELIMTGKQIDAAHAERWGIVNDVAAPDALPGRVQQLVDELRQAAPLAVGMAKRVIDGLSDIDRGLQLEGWAQSHLMKSEDFQEAAQAFLLKRAPNFKGA
jgi:enoyl-CoA hydratase/carnithine racemase